MYTAIILLSEVKAMKNIFVFLTSCVLAGVILSPLYAQIYLDAESGRVYSGYNDVRIPGDGGTKISLTDDLETDPAFYFRGRIGYIAGGVHDISFLAAPLRLYADGTAPAYVRFDNTTFPAGTQLKARYQFDTYRATYRYNLINNGRVVVGLGLTGLLRDAQIRVESDTASDSYSNKGFVPLLNFRVAGVVAGPLGIIFEGDAMGAPQGRAIDIMGALSWAFDRHVTLRAGYRALEGGADNDKVYTFALLHFAVVGVEVRL